MAVNCWFIFVVLLSRAYARGIEVADDHDGILSRLDATEQLVKALYQRVDLLETREKIHLQNIADLQSNDQQQQRTIENLQVQLLEYRQHVKPVEEAASTIKDEETNNETNGIRQEGNEVMHRTPVSERSMNAFGSGAQRIRQAIVDTPIAFLALLSHHFSHAGANQVVNFDKVVTNVGNAYNAVVGVFTAPMEGIYVFSTTLVEEAVTDAHASFYHNDDMINIMYVKGGGGEMTSATVTLHLQKGDVVTVRNDDTGDDGYYGYLHSSFTGFMLANYESSQPIIGK